jgi:hypothetical protein
MASLGAKEVHRTQFIAGVSIALQCAEPTWQFDPKYWALIMPSGLQTT